MQRVHGYAFPTEWLEEKNAPKGCIEINLAVNKNNKGEDWAVFSTKEEAYDALDFLLDEDYDVDRSSLLPKVEEDFPWEHL